MAEIKEFCALRFTKRAGNIAELTCPPYDIISEEQRADYLATNPNNVIRLELPGKTAASYQQAAEVLQEWLENGIVAVDERPALYLYEEAFEVDGKHYRFKGFVCRVKLEEFEKGIVLPHEETLSRAKEDRMNLMCATGCNFSQIYSLYSDPNGETHAILEKLSAREPDRCFTDNEGVTHRLWIAERSPETQQLCAQFRDRKLYIADGHHRYETALNYRNHLRESGVSAPDSDYCMMFLVDLENEGLVVFPTHRIVRGLNGFVAGRLPEQLKRNFEVVPQTDLASVEAGLKRAYDAHQKAFGYCDQNGYWLLTLKDIGLLDRRFPEKSQALRRLDVTVLHSLILEDEMGIDRENMANQKNLTYTRDANEAVKAVQAGANCCFLLNPTRVDEIAAVALAGEKMPQKSTYFYPKLITGLVMNKIR